jgi:hypothetical protein
MAPIKSRKVASSLKKKGFVEEAWRKGHTFYHFHYMGKEYPIETHMSRGSHGEEIHDKVIKAMSEQLCLDRDQFENLVNCPLSEEEYILILKKKGKLI